MSSKVTAAFVERARWGKLTRWVPHVLEGPNGVLRQVPRDALHEVSVQPPPRVVPLVPLFVEKGRPQVLHLAATEQKGMDRRAFSRCSGACAGSAACAGALG